MAMSKRCFVIVLCLVVAIIIGAVSFVVFQMKQQDNTDSTDKTKKLEDESLISKPSTRLDPEKATMMCESIENGTEPSMGKYNHPDMYQASLGVNFIGIRVVTDYTSSDTYQKNSYWLTGDQFADRQAITMIRTEACKGKIPVIVIKMRPREGLSLSRNIKIWNTYQPKQLLETWSDYDKKLNVYLKYLAPIPAIVVLEPDLLMFSYDHNNLQYGWLNDKFKEEFFTRAQKVIRVMARSWVYVDAGNAGYLKVRENMEQMAKSLLRLDGLRGFSINTAHFFNTSYNNMMARRLHCLTGLHYITDTSRNGGSFSRQSTTAIEKCFFDPPQVLRGSPPGWSWGIKLYPRQKRWVVEQPEPPTQQRQSRTTRRQQSQSSSYRTLTMPMGNPPDPQQDPEGYNNYINNMRNSNPNSHNTNYNTVPSGNQVHNFGSIPQRNSAPQPHPNSNNRHNANPNYVSHSNNHNNDLTLPSGRVPITAITPPPTRASIRMVSLRSKEEALSIYRSKTMRRGKCLQMEPVTVHDANVWIKAPGEADGRMYPYGSYQKCLLGHKQPCTEPCRLILNTEYIQREQNCGCRNQNQNSISVNLSPPPGSAGEFFPASDEYHSSSNTGNSNSHSPSQPVAPRNDIPSSYTSLSDILQRAGKKR